jgi:hypothetical protein
MTNINPKLAAARASVARGFTMRTAKRLLPLAAILALAVLTVDIASSQAAGNGGTFHAWESDNLVSGATSIVFTGAVNDYGVDHLGVAGEHHQINRIVLQNGSFEVNVAKLNVPLHVAPGSCTATAKGSGPVALVPGSGTGAYSTVTGRSRATITEVLMFPTTASGGCDTKGKLLAGFAWVTATGQVS